MEQTVQSPGPRLDFTSSGDPEPHRLRRRRILATHPEVQSLAGPAPASALLIVGLVILQLAAAWTLRHEPWWALLACAYLLGAVANHALFVLIHECTHNLAWRGTRANRMLGILANVPIVFPTAMSFRKYHLLHHKYQGDLRYDADLPSPLEARLVGRSAARKAAWMLLFCVFEMLRPMRIKKVKVLDAWTIANGLIMLAVALLVVWLAGPRALLYLGLSTFFGVGLHPVGARWIQEHFVVREGQETYSYYGPWNYVAFNVGYHNEHHDLMTVPWFRLPRLRALAPEFYEGLVAHRSWSRLLARFIFDRRLSLYSRIVRVTPGTPLEAPAHAPRIPAPVEAVEPAVRVAGAAGRSPAG